MVLSWIHARVSQMMESQDLYLFLIMKLWFKFISQPFFQNKNKSQFSLVISFWVCPELEVIFMYCPSRIYKTNKQKKTHTKYKNLHFLSK